MSKKDESIVKSKESYTGASLRQAKSMNGRVVKGNQRNQLEKRTDLTRVMSVTSGKGGVGKSTAALNLAIALAREGKRVLLLDADFGLANLNVLLGLRPQATLHEVFSGTAALSDIILDGPDGIQIIPAASGVHSMRSLTTDQRLFLMQAVEEVAHNYDYLLIDTQAGIGDEVLHFASASNEILCVINSEPTSLTDAYALIKVLGLHYGEKEISVLVNNVNDLNEAEKAFTRLANAAERFLHVELRYKGFIPRDSSVNEAVQEQKALLTLFPSSSAARAFTTVADRIDRDFYSHRIKGGMQFFFQQLVEEQYGS